MGAQTISTRRIHLLSLGCARNQVDSEVMIGRLTRAGFSITSDPSRADVIIVNTCSFIEAAINESIDHILELAGYKTDGRCRQLIVTGCLPERFREKIVSALPEVDLFIGTGGYDRIVEAVNRQFDGSGCLLPDPDGIALRDEVLRRQPSVHHLAYLKIAEGCSKRCTYCIIPKLRGRHKSRPLASIVAEAETLLASGVRELVLVAQDTTAYGRDLTPAVGLGDLLDRLAQTVETQSAQMTAAARGADQAWIRVLYGHPESIDDHTIQAIASHSSLCSYFDIPIQHASATILKKMGRQYSDKDLRRLFEKIRTIAPEAALRTTAIVGFPGETERDFERLSAFIEEVRFDHLGVFVYSDADDLPSHRLPKHVDQQVARTRRDRLMKRQMAIATQKSRNQIGKVMQILIEESPEKNLFVGRSAFQAPEVDGLTYVHAPQLAIGDFVSARIVDALEYDLIGETP
jgi:ribosomal protein S12 methylthiotransferase